MQGKRHTEEQIIAILKEHEAGMKTAARSKRSDFWGPGVGQRDPPRATVRGGANKQCSAAERRIKAEANK
jgi:hypothetical protein